MAGLHRGGSAPVRLSAGALAAFLALACFAYGQAAPPDKEVHVRDLPSITAQSVHAADVLGAALEIVLRDKAVCCCKNSALADSLDRSDPKSLKDIASKLQGRHLLSDGRPIMVTTEYLPPDAVNSGHMINMISNQHPALMEWNDRLYVVYAVTYVETSYAETGDMNVVHKFLLQDPRYSDSRREVSLDRITEDPGKVQGLLLVESKPQ